jgi:hypothetical protein
MIARAFGSDPNIATSSGAARPFVAERIMEKPFEQ